jgi:predicted enzyme related to lactoylglutathione lyase
VNRAPCASSRAQHAQDLLAVGLELAHADAAEWVGTLSELVWRVRPKAEIEFTAILGAVVGTHRADGAELERQPGIHHYGFLVEDLNQAVGKLPPNLHRGASPQVSAGVGGPEGARPAEMRFVDPWGNNVDLSARGFLGREEKKLPGVRLLAVQVPDLAAACEFYQRQFDLELVGWTDDGTVRLSDGTVTLLLTKSQVRPKSGVQYFGIQVDDLTRTKKRLQDDGVAVSEAGRNQVQFTDPEGNRVVVSQQAWNNLS